MIRVKGEKPQQAVIHIIMRNDINQMWKADLFEIIGKIWLWSYTLSNPLFDVDFFPEV